MFDVFTRKRPNVVRQLYVACTPSHFDELYQYVGHKLFTVKMKHANESVMMIDVNEIST